MKKHFKVVMTLALVATMSGSMVACGEGGILNRDDDNVKIDSSKTQFYVSNFDGGFGDEWLYKAIDRFNAVYGETSFEDGKVGVQFHIDPSKNQGGAIAETIKTSRNAVFFTETVNYYDYVNEGLAADITDIVTEPLTAYGESGTIADKFNTQQRNFYKTSDGKYYGIPHYAAYNGITYDVDLFEKKNFYFAADTSVDATTTKYNTARNNGNNGFIYDKTETRSNGPDGKPNTYDDGLPATYEEMFLLCDYIVGAGCTPFIWTGQFRWDYIRALVGAIGADFEGYDQMMLHYTYDGMAEHLVKSIDAQGNVTYEEPTKITDENGYEMLRSAGKYWALYFYQKITSNSSYYSTLCFDDLESHLMAQQDFLFSRPEGKKPIAMLADGTYWINESKGVFEDIAAQYGEEYSQMNRKLAVMPIPKVSVEQIGEPFTVCDGLNSLGFINANCQGAQLEIAKKFLQFVNTDESLREFTVTTNTVKGLNYELQESDMEKMSNFGKNLYEIKTSGNVVYPFSTNSRFINNQLTLSYGMLYDSKIGGTVYNHVANELRGGKVSAKNYFLGLQAQYDKAWWDNLK